MDEIARRQSIEGAEARIEERGNLVEVTRDAGACRLTVIRRDSLGDEDFEVGLRLSSAHSLPDPRAQMLEVEHNDRMVEALLTMGLPLGGQRALKLGEIGVRASFDGQRLKLSNYLDTYQRPDSSFSPFFVKNVGDRHLAPLRFRCRL